MNFSLAKYLPGGYKKAALNNHCAKEQSFGDSNTVCSCILIHWV